LLLLVIKKKKTVIGKRVANLTKSHPNTGLGKTTTAICEVVVFTGKKNANHRGLASAGANAGLGGSTLDGFTRQFGDTRIVAAFQRIRRH
jgi:hypothetical protein